MKKKPPDQKARGVDTWDTSHLFQSEFLVAQSITQQLKPYWIMKIGCLISMDLSKQHFKKRDVTLEDQKSKYQVIFLEENQKEKKIF